MIISEKLKQLQNLIDIQCSEENYNYNEHSLGLTNGLILAMAIFTEEEPKYLDRPDKWIEEIENDNK